MANSDGNWIRYPPPPPPSPRPLIPPSLVPPLIVEQLLCVIAIVLTSMIARIEFNASMIVLLNAGEQRGDGEIPRKEEDGSRNGNHDPMRKPDRWKQGRNGTKMA